MVKKNISAYIPAIWNLIKITAQQTVVFFNVVFDFTLMMQVCLNHYTLQCLFGVMVNKWSVTSCINRTSSLVSCSTVNVKLFHSSELSPLTSNQATELGQTLNENVIKPTQEKVTLMFEVVDVLRQWWWDRVLKGKKNSFRCECAIFYTACLCQFVCFMPAYIKRQKFQGCAKKNKNLCFSRFVTQPWDFQKHTAVICIFGSGCDSM